MTENRFLSFVLTEGALLLFLGLGMLVLPKITPLSFGLMMCLALIIYGGYKVISSILSRFISRHFVLDIITGLVLLITGLMLFFAPRFDIISIISLAGVYFILKSLSSSSFSVQSRKTLNFWWMCLLLSVIEFVLGLIIIVVIPGAALWFIGIILAFDFTLTGIIYLNMYIATKYIQG